MEQTEEHVNHLDEGIELICKNFTSLSLEKKFDEVFQKYCSAPAKKKETDASQKILSTIKGIKDKIANAINKVITDAKDIRNRLDAIIGIGSITKFNGFQLSKVLEKSKLIGYQAHLQFETFTEPSKNVYEFPFLRCSIELTFELDEASKVLSVAISRKEPIKYKPHYVLRTQQKRVLEGLHSFKIEPGEKLVMVAVKPPELNQQRNVQLRAWSTSNEFIELKEHSKIDGVTLYRAEVESESKSELDFNDEEFFFMEIRYDYYMRYLDEFNEATDSLDEIKKNTPILTDAEKIQFLRSDPVKYNFLDERFQKWLNEHELRWNKEEMNEVMFAFKVVTRMHKNFSYSAQMQYRGCGMGGVAQGVIDKQTDCGGYALLISAALRANGIPARVTQGQIFDLKPVVNYSNDVSEAEHTLGLHAMVEFYAEEVGWVPVEATDKQGNILGRDRKGSPFMVRHFDFIYEIETTLPDGRVKKDRPYFMPVFHPVIVHSIEKNLIYKYERQKFTASEIFDDGSTITGMQLDKKEIDARLSSLRQELGVPNSNSNSTS